MAGCWAFLSSWCMEEEVLVAGNSWRFGNGATGIFVLRSFKVEMFLGK